MEPMELEKVVQVLGAEVIGTTKWTCQGVSINTQNLHKNDLFFALHGKTVDGHIYAKEASQKGAAAVVVDRPMNEIDSPQLIVWNTLTALNQLARYYRSLFPYIPLIGITGSVGKTTTKEMLARALQGNGEVLYSFENYNTEIGVPLTLFQMERNHKIAVIEMGMRGRGQIANLTRMAMPDIGIITNVGISHIEHLGSQDEIAHAKAELLSGLYNSGTAVLNKDDECFDFLCSQCQGNVVTFGVKQPSDFQATDIHYKNGQPYFAINGTSFSLKAYGVHYASNTAAVCAAASIIGVDVETVASRLRNFYAPRQRGQVFQTKNMAYILDDTYNAAPDSMCSALQTLSMIANAKKLRPLAILGGMEELGSYSREAHEFVGRWLGENPAVEVLIGVGEMTKHILAGVDGRVEGKYLFENAEEVNRVIDEILQPNDIVLIKGARKYKLESVIEHLIGGPYPKKIEPDVGEY